MVLTDTATTTPLSVRLREETADAHQAAERADFLGALLEGKLSIDAWYGLLEQYQYIYGALETAIAGLTENEPTMELFAVELDRRDAIASDLRALRRRLESDGVGPQPSTLEYVLRIQECRFDSLRLLAHHYTRYLGDLSGGQVMRRLLERHYGLSDGEASFFQFEVGPLPPYKKRYRALLDGLQLQQEDADRIVAEANVSFTCNRQIFTELAEIYAPALAATGASDS